jgi:RHS repeat-associated protein
LYDPASRLTNVTDGTYAAGYVYLANSPLVSQITFRSNSTVRMTTTKTYDYLNRLLQISSVPSASSVVSFDYAYNDANQRVRVNLADGSFWLYEYDSLGQVRSGKRYWSDWTPVAGQQFEYAFDDIGNRSSTKAGGNDVGQGLRPASYTANSLNQYTQRDVPGAADITGIAHPNATVTVNSASPYRRGEYYRKELAINNASASVWQSVTNKAVLTGTTNTTTGNVFLPKTPELFSYDADGNLTNDGRWAYVWDGENRLLRMVAPSSVPTGARKTLVFTYDSQSRRISKVVSNWTGSAWSRVFDERFLYDGWNLMAELNATNNVLVRSYLWGLDLSGSPQGAGGVGGLLAVTIHTSPSTTHFACYDGNGNVVGLVDGRDGTASARYEYGPFAEPIRASGSMCSANPHRFSTKYQDDETELYYYGYRYYSASNGRWLSRDPIEDLVLNMPLYAFCWNDSLNTVDVDGRLPYVVEQAIRTVASMIAVLLAQDSQDTTVVNDVDCPPKSVKRLLKQTTLIKSRRADLTAWYGLESISVPGPTVRVLTLKTDTYGCCKKQGCFTANTTPWRHRRSTSSRDISDELDLSAALEMGGLDIRFEVVVTEITETRERERECAESVPPTHSWTVVETCTGPWYNRDCTETVTWHY